MILCRNKILSRLKKKKSIFENSKLISHLSAGQDVVNVITANTEEEALVCDFRAEASKKPMDLKLLKNSCFLLW